MNNFNLVVVLDGTAKVSPGKLGYKERQEAFIAAEKISKLLGVEEVLVKRVSHEGTWVKGSRKEYHVEHEKLGRQRFSDDYPFSNLKLPIRVRNAVRHYYPESVRDNLTMLDVYNIPHEDLLRSPNFGHLSLAILKAAIYE